MKIGKILLTFAYLVSISETTSLVVRRDDWNEDLDDTIDLKKLEESNERLSALVIRGFSGRIDRGGGGGHAGGGEGGGGGGGHSGGGSEGGSSGSSGASSGGSSGTSEGGSEGGSSGSGSSGSSGTKSSPSTSNADDPPPPYHGTTSNTRSAGGYYYGGSTAPYAAGYRSYGGISPRLFVVPGLFFFPVYAGYHQVYDYPYDFVSNGTHYYVNCLCRPSFPCSCDSNNQTSYFTSLPSDKIQRIQNNTNTVTIYVDGSLNGTEGTTSTASTSSITTSLSSSLTVISLLWLISYVI